MANTIDSIGAVARPGFNALLEDVFGLNVRGLRTLRDLYVSPRKVFDSARVIDWANQHTPTIRLTFSLITVYMLLGFFWAAEDGPLYQSLLAQLEVLVERNPELPPAEDMAAGWFAAYSFAFPLIYMIVHFFVGSVLFVWGKGSTWTTRLRMHFSLLAVGMSLSLFSMVVLPFLTTDHLMYYTIATLGAGFIAYIVTYVRGVSDVHSGFKLWWRALFTGVIVIIADLFIALLTQFGSGIMIGRNLAIG